MTDKVRVGIVGLGRLGRRHAENLAFRVDGAELVAAASPIEAERAWAKGALAGAATYSGLEELLAHPGLDAVWLVTPTSLHADQTIAAIKAGKHVFCEKPIALKAADGKRMVETATACGKLLLIGQVVPFFPEFNFAYKAITSGKYGKLRGGHFKRMISDPTWLPNYFDPATTGGPMLDLHIHDAHFIRLVCGMPRQVQSAGTFRGEVVERLSTQFLFADPGLIVTAATGVIPQQGRPFTYSYEIYLERATILCEYAALPKAGDIVTPVTVLTDNGKVERPKVASGDVMATFQAELAEVVRSVSAYQPSPILSGELARDALTICFKETESVRKGRAVKVG